MDLLRLCFGPEYLSMLDTIMKQHQTPISIHEILQITTSNSFEKFLSVLNFRCS